MSVYKSVIFSFVYLMYSLGVECNVHDNISALPYYYPYNLDPAYALFRNEKSILSFFENEKTRQPLKIEELLRAYKLCFYKFKPRIPEERKKPFIVIEGNYFPRRKEVTKLLAKKMEAKIVSYLPRCLFKLRPQYDRDNLEKHAFYALSLYAAAFNVRQVLSKGSAVIMNGYWYEKAAMVMATIQRKLGITPPVGSDDYAQPEDLLKPDMLVYMKCPSNFNSSLRSNQFDQCIIDIYKSFQHPHFLLINSSASAETTVTEIQEKMNEMLGNNYDLSNTRNLDVYPYTFDRKYTLFKDEKSILNYFETERHKQPVDIDAFLKDYKQCFSDADVTLPPGRRKPFIVIEGNSYKNRKKVIKHLARMMNAEYVTSPPFCIIKYRKTFQHGPLKYGYRTLALYASAFKIRQLLARGKTVIMNGYWFEQVAHDALKIKKICGRLPVRGSKIYNQCKDLMKPDMLVYLKYLPERSINIQNISKWDPRTTTIYKRFNFNSLAIIHSSNDINATIDMIFDEMENIIGDKYTYNSRNYNEKYQQKLEQKFKILENEKSILAFLEKEGRGKPVINDLLRAYNECLFNAEVESSSRKRKPFIVIEGKDYLHRRKVAESLAEDMNAKFLSNIPTCLLHFREMIKQRSIAREAYHVLTSYCSAHLVRNTLATRRAVVMNGYWFENAAFNIEYHYKSNVKLPNPGSWLYDPPKDLLMPDMLVFLNYSINYARYNKVNFSPQYINRSIQIYKNFNYKPIVIIDCEGSISEVIEQIKYEMRHLLYQNCSLEILMKDVLKRKHMLFTDEHSILNYLEKKTEIEPKVKTLLENYRNCFVSENTSILKSTDDEKPRFIVIEGYSYWIRKAIGLRLAFEIGGEYLGSPPSCLAKSSKSFKRGTLFKEAYHLLCFYVLSFRIKQLLASGKGVVLNGYWFEHAFYDIKTIFQYKGYIPHSDSIYYRKPTGMIDPDILFILENTDVNIKRKDKYDQRTIPIYESFNCSVTKIDSSKSLEYTYDQIFEKMKKEFSMKFKSGDFNVSEVSDQISDRTCGLFKDKESVLSYFENDKDIDPVTKHDVLKCHKSCFYTEEVPVPLGRRKPFIVIEGNNFDNRKAIIKELAKEIAAEELNNLPTGMKNLHYLFHKGQKRKGAFLSLCLYASAFQVRQWLAKGKGVVMNGYWLEMAAFNMKLMFVSESRLPEKGNAIYNAPTDLMMPDMVIYLNCSSPSKDTVTSPILFHGLDPMTLSIYEKFNYTPIVIIDYEDDINITMTKINNKIRELLSDKYDFNKTEDIDIYPENIGEDIHLFENEKKVLSLLEKERKKEPKTVDEILTAYNMCFVTEDVPLPKEKRRPFIVVEGSNYEHRKKVTKILGKSIGGEYRCNIPQCMIHLVRSFKRDSKLKKLYTMLTFYASAFNVRQSLAKNVGVIMNGYWFEEAVLHIKNLRNIIGRIPKPGSKFYNNPEDLMLPDMVIYINSKSNSLTQDFNNAEVTIPIYKRFKYRHISIIDFDENIDTTMQNVFHEVHVVLGDNFTLSEIKGTEKYVNRKIAFLQNEHSLLNYFTKQKKTEPIAVDRFLNAYKSCFPVDGIQLPTGNRKPFIVIEGNDYTYRKQIAFDLRDMMDALLLPTFPRILHLIRNSFQNTGLKQAFYTLSLYATAAEVKKALSKQIVIINGYWLEQMNLIFGQINKHARTQILKSHFDILGNDILMPDLLIYVDCVRQGGDVVSDSMHLPTLYKFYKKSQKLVYIPVLNQTVIANITAKHIHEKIKYLLGDKFDLKTNVTANVLDTDVVNLDFFCNVLKDKNSILSFLEKKKEKSPIDIEHVLVSFRTYFDQTNVQPHLRQKEPFIVIEGNNYKFRKHVGILLAAVIKGQLLSYFPKCLEIIKKKFTKTNQIKKAIYTLSYYSSAFKVLQLLEKGKAAIINGYWSEQVSRFVANSCDSLDTIPAAGSEIYNHPKDLLMPDVLILINNETSDLQNKGGYLKKMNSIYDKFNFTTILKINPSSTVENTVTDILKKLKVIFYDKFYFNVLPSGRFNISIEEVKDIIKDKASALSYLEKERKRTPHLVDEILTAFESCFNSDDLSPKRNNRQPFIVFEGNNYLLRKRIVKVMAKRIGAQFLESIPKCMFHLRKKLDREGLLKNVFYILCTYACAHEVKQFLSLGHPVVMNGYWSEQISFLVGRFYNSKEVIKNGFGKAIFNPPEDLYMPDILFFLDYTNPENQNIQYKEYEKSHLMMYNIYQQFKNPSVTLIKAGGSIHNIIKQIHDSIQTVLSDNMTCNVVANYTEVPNENFNLYSFVKNESTILSFFEENKANDPIKINEFLKAYKACFSSAEIPISSGKRRPFIVIEGNNYLNREMVSKVLADKLGGSYLKFPPNSLYHFRNTFHRGSILKDAFFSLSLYVAAFNARQLMAKGITVIMNGYWTEQLALLLGKIYRKDEDFPPRVDEMYQHPADLTMPDIVFYLDYKPENFKAQKTVTFSKLMRIYNFFNTSKIKVIDSSYGAAATATNIMNQIDRYLGDKYNLSKTEYKDIFEHDMDYKFGLFKNEKSILSLFEKRKEREPTVVDVVLKAYNTCFNSEVMSMTSDKKKPFIVMEGNNFRFKDTVSKFLAERIGAKLLGFPPKCMYHLRNIFDKRSLLKNAYFALSLYATAFKAKQLLAIGSSVIVNGYWTQQAEFIIGMLYKFTEMLPPSGNDIYIQPEDMLKPDMVIYLNHSSTDKKYMIRDGIMDKMNNKSVEIYKKFSSPIVTIISTSLGVTDAVDQVQKAIKDSLDDKFDLNWPSATNTERDKHQMEICLYKNELSILSFFKEERKKQPAKVDEVIKAYKTCFYKRDIYTQSNKKKPFIVVEGNNYAITNSLAKLFAMKTGAAYLDNVPSCMYNLRRTFDLGSREKHAFFSLSLYASAFIIKNYLKKGRTVVKNGYWSQQAEFNIRMVYKRLNEFPKKGDPIYTPPTDLLIPDLVIFLASSPSEDFMENAKGFENTLTKTIQIYKNFNFTRVLVIEPSVDINVAVQDIHEKMVNAIKGEYDLSKELIFG